MSAPAAVLDRTDDDTLAPDGYELIDGQPVEKQMGAEAAWVAGRLNRRLDEYSERTGAGWAFASDLGYRCFAGRPKLVRKPDVSFVRRDRLPGGLPKGDLRIPPDLAVEVVSPNETVYELDEKVEEYLSVGTPRVWVVNPQARTVIVHRPDGTLTKHRDGDTLADEEVLPGFGCTVRDFLPPAPA
jgi:Uma2 family endonuclease